MCSCHLYILFHEASVQVFANSLIGLFPYCFKNIFYILWTCHWQRLFSPVTNLTSFNSLLTVSSFNSIFYRIKSFNFIKIKVNCINCLLDGLCF